MPVKQIELNPDHVLKADTSEAGAKALQLPPFASKQMVFEKVERFTTFLAEYAFLDKDIIMHFFPSEEVHQMKLARAYWHETFPRVLDPVARAAFGVEPPRLEAQFIEMAIPFFVPADQAKPTPSWYLKARGFTDQLDPHGLVLRFMSALDAALDAENAM